MSREMETWVAGMPRRLSERTRSFWVPISSWETASRMAAWRADLEVGVDE